MKNWLQDLLTELNHASSNEALMDVITRETRKLGFDNCSFGVQLPSTNPQIFIFDNYTPQWRAQYQAEGYLSVDPVVAHGLRTVLPLVWSEEMFAQSPTFWGDAQAHGLHTGWAQSCFNAQGVGGLLTLSRSNNTLSKAELAAHSAQLTELTQAAHECFAMRLMMQQAPEFIEPLHRREHEVLLWVIEGKTAAETGD